MDADPTYGSALAAVCLMFALAALPAWLATRRGFRWSWRVARTARALRAPAGATGPAYTPARLRADELRDAEALGRGVSAQLRAVHALEDELRRKGG
jgi:hypothetical protein